METTFAAKAAWQLLRRRSDVVVAVSPVLLSLVPAVLLRRVLGYRLGVWVQDLYGAALAETGLGGGLLTRATAWLEVSLLRRADAVVVIHEVFRRRLVEAGVDPARIEVVPNWSHVTMPVVDDAPPPGAVGLGPDEVIALHAGNMGVKQGLEGLVDVARLADERGSRVRVVFLGDGSQPAVGRPRRGHRAVDLLGPPPGRRVRGRAGRGGRAAPAREARCRRDERAQQADQLLRRRSPGGGGDGRPQRCRRPHGRGKSRCHGDPREPGRHPRRCGGADGRPAGSRSSWSPRSRVCPGAPHRPGLSSCLRLFFWTSCCTATAHAERSRCAPAPR